MTFFVIISLNKKGDPQGKGPPYQEAGKKLLWIAPNSYQTYFITKNNKLKFLIKTGDPALGRPSRKGVEMKKGDSTAMLSRVYNIKNFNTFNAFNR